MPVIKAADLAYGRLRSPDLDKQEEFLTAFGMVRADRTKNALYMRGTDAPHHIHVTELGEPKYVGIAFHAASLEDLEKLSRAPGASPVEDIDEPGGGKRVRLTDPDGFQVEIVHGMEMLPKIPVVRPAVNIGEDKTQRRNALYIQGRARPVARQAHRPFCRAYAAIRQDARLVPRDARLPLLRRGLCRQQEQHRRLVQPARPRRRLCRPPRLLLHPQRQGRAQPSVATKPPTSTTS